MASPVANSTAAAAFASKGDGIAYSTGVSADSYLDILVLGYLVDCLLMGVVIHQVSAYFQNFPDHRAVIQRMVRIILVFSVIQTITAIVACISSLKLDNQPLELFQYNFASVTVAVQRLCNPFLMGIAHILLAHRCLAFTNSLRVWNTSQMRLFRSMLWAATILCWAFGLIGIVVTTTATKKSGVSVGPVPELVRVGIGMIIANLVTASVLDSIIAAVMIYELHKSRSAFQGTKSVVEIMSRILVANCFLITVYQLSIALAFAFGTVHNRSGLTVVSNDLIGKIYAVTSLLAITRPLEAERARNNPAPYAPRGRGSEEMDTRGTRVNGTGLESTTLTSRRRGSSMRDPMDPEAGGRDEGQRGERMPLELHRSASSDGKALSGGHGGAKDRSSSCSSSDADGNLSNGVATLRFADQPSVKQGGLSPLALPVSLHKPKFGGSSPSPPGSTSRNRPSTAPSPPHRGPSSSYTVPLAAPQTTVKTLAGMGNEYGLDLDYICAPMEDEGVVKSGYAPRGPSPRLFD